MRGATRYKQRRNSTGEQDAPAFFVPAFAFECALVQARDAVQVALELDVSYPCDPTYMPFVL